MRIWDPEANELLEVVDVGEGVQINSVAWRPGTYELAYGKPDGTVEIIVPSSVTQSPVADAGADQTFIADGSGFATVTLDGSASFDPDGEIVSYVWTLDGVEIALGAMAQVQLGVGMHEITLTVTDNDGATASDTVTIRAVGNNHQALTDYRQGCKP